MSRLLRVGATAGLAIAVLLGVLAGVTDPARAAGHQGHHRHQPPQLRRQGRWLVDPQGRIVIVHGLNLVYKRKPYVPPNDATGFTAKDARWLAQHGFNSARVGTLWAGLTPTAPGQADPGYIQAWQRVLDLLAKQKIWMQLDMHQDEWHEQYGGEGVPDWAAAQQLPYSLAPPVVAPFPQGYWTPEVSSMFDDFWADRRGLLDGWLQAWQVAVKAWSHQPYLMGYDLLNEPWMGAEWPTCLSDGCPDSIRTELQPAMEKGLATVRALDKKNIVWWEPQQFAGGQAVGTFLTAPSTHERNLGYSWHNYCPQVFLQSQGIPGADVKQCKAYTDGREGAALQQAATMHAVPMMSEWGATDDLTAIRLDAASADRHLMGWTHWAYKYWNDPTTADHAQGLFKDDTDLGSVKQGSFRLLERTYAQATAGTPLTMHYRPRTGRFFFRYRPDPSITAPTRIFVNSQPFPHGYTVAASHADYRRHGHYLLVRARSHRVVTLQITPRG